MSLEKVLIEWCDKYINISSVSYYRKEEETDDKLMYYDCTGYSGHDSGYNFYLQKDGTYKISYCDSYTDEPDDQFPLKYKDCKDIKEAIMFAVVHDLYFSAEQTQLLQMMLNGVEIGYRGNREEVQKLHDFRIDLDNEDYEEIPTHEKDYLLKTLNIPLDIEKCIEINDYYIPDLRKCDDTDVEFINMIKRQIEADMEYMIRT